MITEERPVVPRVDFQGCGATKQQRNNDRLITGRANTTTREAKETIVSIMVIIFSALVRQGCDDPAHNQQINERSQRPHKCMCT